MIHTTKQAVAMVGDFLDEKAPLFGIRFVGRFDEKRIPNYPAVVVVPGTRDKTIHATQTFNVDLELHLYVYHADLTLTKRERSEADLKLVEQLEEVLEEDYGWQSDPLDPATKRVVFGYISNEEPGVLQPRANKSNMIISTRMTWRALSQRRFSTQ